MKNTLFLLVAACLIVGCGGGKKKANAQTKTPPPTYTITSEGVGTFPVYISRNEVPTLEGYNVKVEGNEGCCTVTDMDGEVVITQVVELFDVMYIYSPLFKTVDGIGVGSMLSDLLKVLPKYNIATDSRTEGEWFVFQGSTEGNNLCYFVRMDQLKDPSELKNMRADPSKLTLQAFKPEANIDMITITDIDECF